MMKKRTSALFIALTAVSLMLVACGSAATEATTAPTPTEAGAEAEQPSVVVSDQDATDGTVNIEDVHARDQGWMVIHADQDGAPGPVIGQAPVSAGENHDVSVEIDLESATPKLYAMLHLDSGNVGEYEFPGDDVPVTNDQGEVVVVPFNVALPESGMGNQPSITVSNQSIKNGTVTIDEVVAAEDGWLVVHINEDGGPGPVIGHAAVEAGTNTDVQVEIDELEATTTLFAMLHVDAGTAGEYEFPGDDVPEQNQEGEVVVVPFEVEMGEPMEEGYTVEVIDSRFQPGEITVPVGATVTWIHQAQLSHTVTADEGLFDSGTLRAGDTFSFTFEEAGEYPYYCKFHGNEGGSGMSGTVIVEG